MGDGPASDDLNHKPCNVLLPEFNVCLVCELLLQGIMSVLLYSDLMMLAIPPAALNLRMPPSSSPFSQGHCIQDQGW